MMARLSSLKTKLAHVLVQAGRIKLFRPGVLFFFKHMDLFLPVDRLYENDNWLAFYHPQPAYPLHLLILPKQSISSLQEASLDSPEIYRDLMAAVQMLVKQFDLESRGYRLITNGGPNQSIPQWHWHLISETPGEMHD